MPPPETSEEQNTDVDPLDELDVLEHNDVAREVAAKDGVELPPDQPSPESGIQPTEEERRYAGKFTDPDELERGYVNAEQELGRLRNEVGELRASQAELDAYRRTYQPPAQQQEQPQGSDLADYGLPELSQEQLEDLAVENPLAAIDYISTLRAVEIASAMYQQFSQEFAPVRQDVNRQAGRDAVEELKRQYGDDVVLRNKERVAEMVQNDEAFYAVEPKLRNQRLGMALMSAEYERQHGGAQERASNQPRENGRFAPAAGGMGDVHVEGGSTPPQPSQREEVDPIIAEMEQVVPEQDTFGARPGVMRR